MKWHTILVGLVLLSAIVSNLAGAEEPVYSAPGIGFIEIRSDIDGARVYFDTLYMGYVWGGSLIVPVDTTVSPSWKNIRMEYSNYTPFAGPFVQTEPGKTVAYKIDLSKDSYDTTGMVQFVSDPSGAEFTLNNISMGMTPDSGILVYYTVPRGLYTVTTRRPGDTTLTDQLYVDDNALTNYRVKLTESPFGGLLINSTPKGAELFLDNALRGITPLELSDITIGDHAIIVRKDGFQDWIANVSVTGGSIGSVEAVLVTKPASSQMLSNGSEKECANETVKE